MLKVHGKEQEAPPWLQKLLRVEGVTEDERQALIRTVQRGEGADHSFREASMMRDQILGMIQSIKGNPREGLHKLLSHPGIGLDLKQVAQEILAQDFELEAMTPEQRELHELRKERDALKSQREQEQQQADTQREAAFRSEYAANLQKQIIGALQEADLPTDVSTVRRIGSYLRQDMQRRSAMDPNDPRRAIALEPRDVIPLVREDYQNEHQLFVSKLKGKQLIDYLGDAVLKEIRAYDVGQYEQQGAPTNGAQPSSLLPRRPPPQPEGNGRQTFSQIRERLGIR